MATLKLPGLFLLRKTFPPPLLGFTNVVHFFMVYEETKHSMGKFCVTNDSIWFKAERDFLKTQYIGGKF